MHGTMNVMGSTVFTVSLYAHMISHSKVLTAQHGMKHILCCGLLNLCSLSMYRLLFSYSTHMAYISSEGQGRRGTLERDLER